MKEDKGLKTALLSAININEVRRYPYENLDGCTLGAVAGNPNIGTTDALGTITVVINANAVEQPTTGALVAQQVNADATTALTATFTVQ